jgi:hypothetical protein
VRNQAGLDRLERDQSGMSAAAEINGEIKKTAGIQKDIEEYNGSTPLSRRKRGDRIEPNFPTFTFESREERR